MFIEDFSTVKHVPNTSEGFSSSRSLPPLLVSYVANPPSLFLMLSSCKTATGSKELRLKQTEIQEPRLHNRLQLHVGKSVQGKLKLNFQQDDDPELITYRL